MSRSPFFGEGIDEAMDRAWDGISIDNGTLALDPPYAKAMGLPPAQPFPWDASKGLYLFNGYHSMHCLVSKQTISNMSLPSPYHDRRPTSLTRA
jgi:hypothetical protein